ncbi:MAG TPA: hypothetical protein VFH29_05425 [Anaerolineales bacterium]|nr:hypothetical protein [Anaerolineales bacterium]
MNEIEMVLDDCLRRMRTEGLTQEDLLALYPERAAELRPLLAAAFRLQAASEVSPAPAYVSRSRAQLMNRVALTAAKRPQGMLPAWRMAVALAGLVLVMLMSTTAFAQVALPGQALYGWKLGSEAAWRAVSPDPVGVDLKLAERRTDELKTVVHDPAKFDTAKGQFHAVLDRLEAERDPQNDVQISDALVAHQKSLESQGIRDSKLDELVGEKGPKKK